MAFWWRLHTNFNCCKFRVLWDTQIIVKLSSSAQALANSICDGDRNSLAKAITLAESSRIDHRQQIEAILEYILENDKKYGSKKVPTKALRLGVTGPPGAGKSTFIESLGLRLISSGHRVAVIPVDPSSPISGGSILGDKTRMPLLSESPHAFIRASPTRGLLGGIAAHTMDVIGLCEASGFDVVLVESVGSGQSEVDLDQAVDMLVLLLPPGGGDHLQAAKKGVMEVADLVLVNKADGDLLRAAELTRAEYAGTMQLIRRRRREWEVPVLSMSAKTGTGVADVVQLINKFQMQMTSNGTILQKRAMQASFWMWAHFRRTLILQGGGSAVVRRRADQLLPRVGSGEISASRAAALLVDAFCSKDSPDAPTQH